ncbi:MAG: ribosome biogenesis GTPase Der [Pseudomonadota bacterium]
MSFSVAIVGRPNVGKSTLFNRLVGKRVALVDDQPGVTRDLREGEARLGDMQFTVIDTAGLEEITDESLQGRMRKLTERAVRMADLCLFLVDARDGVTPTDEALAELLRRQGADVILAANKAEGRAAESGIYEAFSLGLGEPIGLSAEHGEGMGELYAALMPHAERLAERDRAEAFDPDMDADEMAEHRPLQIAIVGRPNAGKSTLVNRILGEDRLLTGPEAGITRDAIGLETEWDGRRFKVFDTAGLRKKAKVQEKVERLSTSDATRAIRFAEVVVLLMDEANAFETQDLRIADLAEREGRAVVYAISKWDLAEDRDARVRELRERASTLLPQLSGTPVVLLSSLTGRGLPRLKAAIEEQHRLWNTRISTSKLNDWLAGMITRHPPPAPGGRRIKLRYMTQIKSRPPSFLVFSPRAEEMPAAYSRYLINGLREDFGLAGVPIRLNYRKGENPYANKG